MLSAVADVSDAAAIESNLSDRQPLASDHYHFISTAHCGATGQPGRDATVTALHQAGHKP